MTCSSSGDGKEIAHRKGSGGYPMIRGSRGRADSDNSSSKERRGARRYPFKASAYVVDAESNARVISRASDLNLGGCHVDAITCLPVGTAVWLRLTKAEQSFT